MNFKNYMNEEIKDTEAYKGIMDHKTGVSEWLEFFSNDILKRAKEHDNTKLESPEWEIFLEYTPKLKTYEFDSKEYKDALKEMKVALDHHYAEYRHHPEHFENGIKDMTLIDLLEMLVDWNVSTKRNKNGDLNKSISEFCKKRFGYGEELERILLNTAKEFKKDIKNEN